MGILSTVAGKFRTAATRGGRQATGQQQMLDELRNATGRDLRNLTDAELTDAYVRMKGNDTAQGALATLGGSIAKPLGVAGVAGSGAWAANSYFGAQGEQEKTERFQTYQRELSELQERYDKNEISRSQYEERRQALEEAYDQSNDNQSPGIGGWFKNLGLMGKAIVAVTVAVAVPSVVKLAEVLKK